MASVFKRKDRAGKPGRFWYIQYTDAQGRVRKKRAYSDKALSWQLAREIEAKVEREKAGLITEPMKQMPSLEEAILRFEIDLKSRSKSKVFVENQIRYIRGACNDLKRIPELTTERIERYILKEPKWSNGTKNNARAAIVGFCKWLMKRSWIENNPASKIDKWPATRANRVKIKRAFTMEELTRLLATAPKERAAVYKIMAFSGLRWGDMKRLEWRDCDLSDPNKPRWRLRAEAVKEKRSCVLPISPECVEAFPDLPSVTKMVVEEMINPRTLYRDLRKAGIERKGQDGREVSFHSFRYFFATLWASRLPLVKVQKLMRHASIQTTASVYIDLGIEDLADEVFTLNRTLTNNSTTTDQTEPKKRRKTT
jgi:integrase